MQKLDVSELFWMPLVQLSCWILLGLGSVMKLCESIFKLLNIIYSPSETRLPPQVQHYVVQYCSRRLYFRPPEEYIGFMNKYRILSPGSRNSYLQHSINSNLKLAKTSSRGKFATSSNIKHDFKSCMFISIFIYNIYDRSFC